MVNISICILNYNGAKHLQDCLESVPFSIAGVNVEKLLIDNASSDDSWRMARNYGFRVIHADNKYQFITGLNTALTQFQMDYILFSQADLKFGKDSIRHLIKEVENDHLAIVQPVFYRGQGKCDNAGMHWIWPGYGISRTFPKSLKTYLTSIVTSITFVTSRKAIEKIGLFDERFAPAYYEDCDYSLRAKKVGIKLKVCPLSIIFHKHTSSFSKLYSKDGLSKLCYENRMKLVEKHYNGFDRWLRLKTIRVAQKIYTGRIFSDSRIASASSLQ